MAQNLPGLGILFCGSMTKHGCMRNSAGGGPLRELAGPD
jgi:hypothetical protein